MFKEVLIFLIGSLLLVKSAQYTVSSIARLARAFKLTEFVTSFILVALVAALPEGFISILAALNGDSSMAAGTLIGAIIADLTLIFGLVVLIGKPIRIQSAIVKKDLYFVMLIILPILLGLNGVISRVDGVILILAGVLFIATLMKEKEHFTKPYKDDNKASLPLPCLRGPS